MTRRQRRGEATVGDAHPYGEAGERGRHGGGDGVDEAVGEALVAAEVARRAAGVDAHPAGLDDVEARA